MVTPEAIRSSGKRIALLSGGDSTEREVSLVSGRSVADALAAMEVPCDLFELETNCLPDAMDSSRHVVLPLIHGAYGEDGRLSAELEAGGYAYAGCDYASSVLCFDKLASKAMAARMRIPVAMDRLLEPDAPVGWTELSGQLGVPMILKPRRDGSSVGLHCVRDAGGYDAAAGDLARETYLAESYVDGVDLTVGVLGNRPLGVVAVHPEGGLYDYRHKYTQGLSRYEVPAAIEPSLSEQLQRWAMDIFHACGCRDLARVDFRMGKGNQVVFLEINTLPGMTPTSLLPKSAQCMDISFNDLILSWIGFSLNRIRN